MARPGSTPLDFQRFRGRPTRPAAAAGDATSTPEIPIAARQRRTREILSRVESLPSLPSIVMEVLQLANDNDTRTSDFESILRKDQALTAKVLKLANSPFFGLRNKVSSISQAIVILGFKSLKSVVIAAKASKLLDRQLHIYRFSAGGMWKHSMSCATICRDVAARLRMPGEEQEELFVAGLLHDVGKILLAPYVEEEQDEWERIVAAEGVSSAERTLAGVTHEEVGGRMAIQWGLAPSLANLIRDHHARPSTTTSLPLAILQVSNELCAQVGIGRIDGSRPATETYAALLSSLDLLGTKDELEENVRRRIDELAASFRTLAGDDD